MTKEDRCNAVVQDLMRVFGERAMVQFLDYREKARNHSSLQSFISPELKPPQNGLDTWTKGSVYDSEYKQPTVAASKHYVERTSYWRRGVFFITVLCLGILVYSKKYKLSYTARAMKPLEKALIKFSTGIDWPQ
ncbi:hypothetical protein TELCIR_03807 [Teladorsagia circumcincta]|uniref:Uncharacterized protein n=1 Tax=Teladorsagia circumcincta TaxID=45464 RepID=A0A2G9UVA1_TELCI|nr:hypothetical protein TELCIR_03807 [Teladorsagia circumcincta]